MLTAIAPAGPLMRLFATLFVLLLIASVSLLATAADVYRWTDKDGVVHYGDQPPTKDAKPTKLPPIQTVPFARQAPASADGAAPAKPAAPTLTLTVTAPKPEETLRDATRKLPISVALSQPLPPGAGLVYLLDGRAQNTPPIDSTSYTLDSLDRGTHLVAVAAVDARGKELARSAPVIVHMKPPSAR